MDAGYEGLIAEVQEQVEGEGWKSGSIEEVLKGFDLKNSDLGQ